MTAKDHKANSTSSLKHKFQMDEEDKKIAEEQFHAQMLEHPSYLELQDKLTAAEKEAETARDRMLRIQAETDNIQRRVQRDVENAHKYGLEKFALELLPVVDSLERAMTLSDDHEQNFVEGVKLTLKMFYAALDKFGVKQIDPISEPFNPELHQAVSTVVNPAVAPNTVMDVLQKGFTLNNRLIRPALVIVSKSS